MVVCICAVSGPGEECCGGRNLQHPTSNIHWPQFSRALDVGRSRGLDGERGSGAEIRAGWSRAVKTTKYMGASPRRPSGRLGSQQDHRRNGLARGNADTTRGRMEVVVVGDTDRILKITLERASGADAVVTQPSIAAGPRAVARETGIVAGGPSRGRVGDLVASTGNNRVASSPAAAPTAHAGVGGVGQQGANRDDPPQPRRRRKACSRPGRHQKRGPRDQRAKLHSPRHPAPPGRPGGQSVNATRLRSGEVQVLEHMAANLHYFY